jgi:DNA-binding LacI/PurR family transcriptional regulator
MKRRLSKKRPTSQDVARRAGVSVTTVSYVVNDRHGGSIRISDATRRKVWEAVNALNYRPLSAARTLRTKRSNMLALMIPYIETPYFPQLTAAIQREAEKEGFRVIIYDTRHELWREQDFVSVLPSHGVDGVIIHSENLLGDRIDTLVASGVAVVIHGNSPTHPFADNVLIDEVRAAEEAVSYLIEKGHSRIGLILQPENTWPGALRREGYVKALQGHGVSIDPDLMCEADFSWQDAGAPAMKRLLTLPDPPSAVFCAADRLAIDALLFVLDSGLSVPDDVAIMGFGDTSVATRVRPRLTAIRKDAGALGAMAVQLLMERLHSDEPLPSRQVVVDHKLIVRESA